MIKIQKNKAYTQVLEVLNFIKVEDYYKVPKELICALEKNKLVVEGKITFNSGKEKNTKFVFEAKKENNKIILEGLNADFATEKAFVLNCNLDTANRLVVESLNYKYTINNTLVEGLVK